MMSLLNKTIETLTASTVNLALLKETSLEETRNKILRFREKFHLKVGKKTYNMKPFCDKLMHRLNSVIRKTGNNDELNPKLKELQVRDKSDELRIKVKAIIKKSKDKYFFSPNTIQKLKEVIGIQEDLTFKQEPDYINLSDNVISFFWDLDVDYEIIDSPFIKLQKQSELLNDSTDSDGWGFSSPPDYYNGCFLLEGILVSFEYKSYGGGYSHGDDFRVSILFQGNQSLDALLLDPIAKKTLLKWRV